MYRRTNSKTIKIGLSKSRFFSFSPHQIISAITVSQSLNWFDYSFETEVYVSIIIDFVLAEVLIKLTLKKSSFITFIALCV